MVKPFGKKYSEGIDRYGDGVGGSWPCVLCGRPVKNLDSAVFLRVVDGGGRFAKSTEDVDLDGDMGSFPVGPDCYRKNPELKRFVETE